MSKPDGGPAFPVTEPPAYVDPDESGPAHKGMTLRDYFAGQALLLLAWEERAYASETVAPVDAVARHAYELADAMLKVREQSS